MSETAPDRESNATLQLHALEQERIEIKAHLDATRKELLDVEQQILTHPALPDLKSGVNNLGFTKITQSVDRQWDQAALVKYRAAHEIPDAHWPFKVALKEDAVKSKYLRENFADFLTAIENAALTEKPRKASFAAVKVDA